MTTKSRLYYEAHVNFPHPTEEQAETIRAICAAMPSWRMATFEMHKERQPTGFCTGRSENLSAIKAEVAVVTMQMEEAGIKVLRWKLEDTLFDSNRGDSIYEMLSDHSDV